MKEEEEEEVGGRGADQSQNVERPQRMKSEAGVEGVGRGRRRRV